MKVSKFLVNFFKEKGVATFFGVQGGAIAHMIESAKKNANSFFPVLNEQTSGMYAHGAYMASSKPMGSLSTTGPGFLNSVTGLATCYFDGVPSVFINGQVQNSLNKAEKFKTKMYGFQEVQHHKISKHLSDKCFKINNYLSLLKMTKLLNQKKTLSETIFIDLSDDFSRYNLSKKEISNIKIYKTINTNKEKKIQINLEKILKKSNNTVFVFGQGYSRNSTEIKKFNTITKNLNIPCVFTWGGSFLFNKKNKNHIGYFGSHTPGLANQLIDKADLLVSFGCGFLQHQVGKKHNYFSPNSQIIYINNNVNEIKKSKKDFGKRLIGVYENSEIILKKINKIKNKINKKKSYSIDYKPLKFKNSPVFALSELISLASKKNFFIFSDAGASLSWTYQAANIKKINNVFTSYNIHTMGYSIAASIGASLSNKKSLAIIGDGGFMMNCQELANLKKIKKNLLKILILDNSGYSIIKQTQDSFFKSNYVGSDVGMNKFDLPNFTIKNICKSYDLKVLEINSKNYKKKIKNFFNSNYDCLILKVNKSDRVENLSVDLRKPLNF